MWRSQVDQSALRPYDENPSTNRQGGCVMDKATAQRIMDDFFADRKNAVGDHWSKSMAKQAFDSLLAEPAATVASVAASCLECRGKCPTPAMCEAGRKRAAVSQAEPAATVEGGGVDLRTQSALRSATDCRKSSADGGTMWLRNDDFDAIAALLRAQAAEVAALREQLADYQMAATAEAHEVDKRGETIAALRARAVEMEAQRDDYLNREWIAVKAKNAAERDAEGLRADALRYRWLRAAENGEEVSSLIQIYNYGEEAVMLDGAELDAAIDASLEARP